MRKPPVKRIAFIVLIGLTVLAVWYHAIGWLPSQIALANEPSIPSWNPASVPPPPTNLELPPFGQRSKPQVSKLDSALDRLAQLRKGPAAPEALENHIRTHGLEVADGRVLAMVTLVSEADYTQVAQAIRGLKGDVAGQYKRWLDVRIPIEQLTTAAAIEGVAFIEQPPKALQLETTIQSGAYMTEGAAAAGVDAWHSAGYTGQGVKVAIFDYFEDYQRAQALGDLPAQIEFYPNSSSVDYSSPHGTAVAEIIHDMAPDASLVFATPQTPVQRANYIIELAQQGVKVISSSTGTVGDTPGDGTGPVADAIATAATQYGVIYIQAAGNQANYHWDGVFDDTVSPDGVHEFTSNDTRSQINMFMWHGSPAFLPPGFPLSVYLRWDDWPASNQDYDLYLVAWDGASSQWVIVAGSANAQNGIQPPIERIQGYVTQTATYYGILIHRFDGTRNVTLDLNAFNVPDFQFVVPQRSLVDEATAEYAVSVAAVDAATYNLEPYSSRGPTRGPGGTIGGGKSKPDIAAYANVSTFEYGSQGFNGTSAATPHVSGAAALLWSAFPTYSRNQIVAQLHELALDLGSPGYDYEYGYGRLNLSSPPQVPTPTPTPNVSPTPTRTPVATSTPTVTIVPMVTPTSTPTSVGGSLQWRSYLPLIVRGNTWP